MTTATRADLLRSTSVLWAALLVMFAGACHAAAAGPAAAPPVFTVGVFDKVSVPAGSPVDDSRRRLPGLLSGSGINTLVVEAQTDPDAAVRLLDSARDARVGVLLTSGNPLNPNWDFAGPGRPYHRMYSHPAVIGLKYGDEPSGAADLGVLADGYGALRRHYAVPVMTALVGENMTGGEDDIAVLAWQRLRPAVRLARYYPFRRTEDLLTPRPSKARLGFAAWCALMEHLEPDTPWWYVAQGFGHGIDRAESSYWRLPTAAELNASIHVALAHGARGILAYSLQPYAPGRLGLTDSELQPTSARDGSRPFDQLALLARLIGQHAALLATHLPAAVGAEVDNAVVHVVARRDPANGDLLLYVVNLDTEHSTKAVASVAVSATYRRAVDVFTGTGYPVALDEGQGRLQLQLEAGQARLLRFE